MKMYWDFIIGKNDLTRIYAFVIACGINDYSKIENNDEDKEMYRETYKLIKKKELYQEIFNEILEKIRSYRDFSNKLFDDNISLLEKELSIFIFNSRLH